MIRSLLACLLFLPTPLLAQQGGADTSVRLRAITFQLNDRIAEVYAHAPSAPDTEVGVPVEVKTYLNEEAARTTFKSPSVIFTDSPDRSSLKDPERVLGKTKIPKGARSVILMFIKGTGEKGDPKYRCLPVEDSKSHFPPGSIKVLNLSPFPMALVLEKKPFALKAGESTVIEDPPVGMRQQAAMQAAVKFTKNGDWEQVATGAWPHPGRKRVVQVAFYDPKKKSVSFQGIKDIVEFEAAPAP